MKQYPCNHVAAVARVNFSPPGAKHGCHGFPLSCAMEFRCIGGVIEGSMVYRNDLCNESTLGNVSFKRYLMLSDFRKGGDRTAIEKIQDLN